MVKFLKPAAWSAAFVFLAASLWCVSYADERNYAHLHIKGKITDRQGRPVKDAELFIEGAGSSGSNVKAPFVTGVSSSVVITAEATESGPGGRDSCYKTSAGGEYHIILGFSAPRAVDPDPDVYAFTIDRSKMRWQKARQVISPK